MNLTRIRATNLYRRQDLDFEVGGLTVFRGPNESGKSTALGVIRLVLDGPSGPTWPLLGERPDYDWRAELSFDRGGRALTVARGMFRGDHYVLVDGAPIGLREAAKVLSDTLGTAVAWSAQNFMQETARARMEWLLARVVEGEGWTREHLFEVLGSIGELTDIDALATDAWRSEATSRQALDRLMSDLRAQDVAADQDARRLSKVVEHEGSQGAAAGEALPPGTVASWTAERERIDAELAKAHQARGQAEAADKAAAMLRQEQDRLFEEMNKCRDEAAWAERKRNVDERVRGAQRGEQEASQTLVAAQNARDSARAHAQSLRDQSKALAARLADAKAELRVAQAVDQARGALSPALDLLKRIGADHSSPYHQEALTVVGDLAMLFTGEVGQAVGDFERELRGVDVQLEGAERALVLAEAKFHDEMKRTAEASAAVTDALKERERCILEDTVRLQHAASLAERYERLTAEIQAAGSASLDAIEAQIEALTVGRKDAQRNIDALTDAAGARAAQLGNRELLQGAKDRRGKIREALKALEGVRGQMTAALFAPLQERVSAITLAVLGARWNPAVTGGWDWALWRDDAFHAHGSRSGGVVAMAALHIAIAEHLGGWRHVVLDDLENLEVSRRNMLLDALRAELIAGRLDNAVVACVTPWDDITPRAVVHTLGGAHG